MNLLHGKQEGMETSNIYVYKKSFLMLDFKISLYCCFKFLLSFPELQLFYKRQHACITI